MLAGQRAWESAEGFLPLLDEQPVDSVAIRFCVGVILESAGCGGYEGQHLVIDKTSFGRGDVVKWIKGVVDLSYSRG